MRELDAVVRDAQVQEEAVGHTELGDGARIVHCRAGIGTLWRVLVGDGSVRLVVIELGQRRTAGI